MTTQSKPRRMTVAEFLDWASVQPRGRYELVQGEVVAMAPGRQRHLRVKGAVFRALGDAVARAGLPYTVFPDGATVVIDNNRAREPDAAVQADAAGNLDSVVLAAPIIVVEVTSPSSERDDTGDKVLEYFSVPSIVHYLIVDPVDSVVIHHTRGAVGDGERYTREAGEINLTPPGIRVPVAELLPEIG
jgi:Uma2 family endonuclease